MTTESHIWSPLDIPSGAKPGNPARLFALQATADLGKAVAHALGGKLAAHEERAFEDGEHKVRPLDAVGGADVYVVQSLHGGPSESANDKLCRLLFFIGALKDAGAARVTAVVPYLCYARKDRRTKPNDPVTTRYIAGMFEAVGTDCIVTLEVHNPVAFENAFRCRTVTLTGTPLFVDYVRDAEGRQACAWCRPIPAAPSGRNCSARRWKQHSAVRSARRSPTSIAVPASSPATSSSAMWRERPHWLSTT